MNNLIYNVIVEKKENGYQIGLPDFNEVVLESNNLDLVNLEKQIYTHLNNCIWQQYQRCQGNNQSIPMPLSQQEISKGLSIGQIVFSLVIDIDKIIDGNANKLVKKTLVIPAWLNQQADLFGINFSETLQNALKYKMNISIGSIYPIMDEETGNRLVDRIVIKTIEGKLKWKEKASAKDMFILQRQLEIQKESRILIRTRLNDEAVFILADSLAQMERVGYVVTQCEVYQIKSTRFEELTQLIIKNVSSVYEAVEKFLQ